MFARVFCPFLYISKLCLFTLFRSLVSEHGLVYLLELPELQ
ncbi:unnamed protein product [Arabidopsis halleri]